VKRSNEIDAEKPRATPSSPAKKEIEKIITTKAKGFTSNLAKERSHRWMDKGDERRRNGETEKWRDGEMEKRRDGENGDVNRGSKCSKTLCHGFSQWLMTKFLSAEFIRRFGRVNLQVSTNLSAGC